MRTLETSTVALLEAIKLAAEQDESINTLKGDILGVQEEVQTYKTAAAGFFAALQTSGLLGDEDITKMASNLEDPVTAFEVAGKALELIADSQSSGFGVAKEASVAQEEDPWDLVKREGA